MNRLFVIPLMIVLVSGLIFGGCAAPAPAPAPPTPAEKPLPTYHWRMTFDMTHEHPVSKAQEWFCEEVGRRSNGRIIIDYYPDSILGTWDQNLDEIMKGTLEMGNQGFSTAYDPRVAVAWTPHLFSDWESGAEAIDPAGGWLWEMVAPLLELQKQHPLAFYGSGFQGIGFRAKMEAVTSLDDWKGMKIRVNPATLSRVRYEALGFLPTPMGWGDVFSALQTGVLDAGGHMPVLEVPFFSDAIKTWVDTRDCFESMAHIMNLELWESLSPQDQQILTEVAEETWRNQMATAIDDERKFWEEGERLGVNMVKLSPELHQEMDDRYTGILYPWLRDVIGDVLMDQILAGRTWKP